MTDNRTTELLPCPWCGKYPKLAEDGGSDGPWFCVWHDCPPVEGGKARHYGESLGCISISTTWFHTEAEAIAAWNTRTHGTLTAELVEKIVDRNCEWYEGGDIDAQAIADELNAALSGEICEMTRVGYAPDAYKCSLCGETTAMGRTPKACPQCGAKAVKR